MVSFAFCFLQKLYAQNHQPELMHYQYAKFTRAIDSISKVAPEFIGEANWNGFYWQMAITQYYPADAQLLLKKQVLNLAQLSATGQSKLIEAVSSVADSALVKLIWHKRTALKTTKAKLAIDILYRRFTSEPIHPNSFISKDDTLWLAAANLCASYDQATVDINTLLDTHFLPGQYVYISLQYRNRDTAGQLRVRTPRGEWLRTSTNELVQFPQLARSITGLPFCITNGNTPQGLYKVGTIATSNNAWIGATPNVQLALPFEPADEAFFDSANGNSYAIYQNLLGVLANHGNLWEAYYAGALGRSEIIAHGTAIPTQWYSSKAYNGFTPSMGCLCMPETWYTATKPASSVQEAFINLHQSLPVKPRYLLVVNVW